MRKSRRPIVLMCLCLLALFTFGLAGCADPDGNVTAVGDLSCEQVIEIRDAYFDRIYGDELFAARKYDKNCIVIVKYCGTYDGSIVVILRDNADENISVPDVVVPVYVDGMHIGDLPNPLYDYCVYRPATGAVMRLGEAYEGGYLDRADLKQIAAAGGWVEQGICAMPHSDGEGGSAMP